MAESVVYSASPLQATRAARLLEEHGIACHVIANEQQYSYAHRRVWNQKPGCHVVVAAEQLAQAQQLIAPLQLRESQHATRIARSIGWRLVGMALSAMSGTVFLIAAMFGPRINAIGAVACYLALLVLLLGASHHSPASLDRERP